MAKISELLICVNCDEVFNIRRAPRRHCPKCGGQDARPLSTWIGSLAHIATALKPKQAECPAVEVNP